MRLPLCAGVGRGGACCGRRVGRTALMGASAQAYSSLPGLGQPSRWPDGQCQGRSHRRMHPPQRNGSRIAAALLRCRHTCIPLARHSDLKFWWLQGFKKAKP